MPETGATLCGSYGNLPADITIGSSPLSVVFASQVTTWGAVNGIVQNKTIRVNGTLNMNIFLTFVDCKFTMAPGSLIQLLGTTRFSAFDTKFFCCTYIWQGIIAKDNSTIDLWGCQIEDATTALTVDDGVPAVALHANIFNRNYVGIKNGAAVAGGNSTLDFSWVAGNFFDNTSAHNVAPPLGFQITHILLDKCAASIFGWGGTNSFSNAHYGIYLKDADLNIAFAFFGDQMGQAGIFTDGFYQPSTGSHIRARFCYFDINNEDGFAIYGYQSDMDIAECEITGRYLDAIASFENNSSERVRISDNRFTCLPQAYGNEITVHRPIAVGPVRHLEINDNRFNYEGLYSSSAIYGGRGIEVLTNVDAHVSDFASVSRNIFNIEGPDANGVPAFILNDAILINTIAEFDNTTVNGNIFNVGNTLLDYGIRFNDQLGAGNEISHNTINEALEFDNFNDPNTFFGITVNNATSGIRMCSNLVTGSKYGIIFEANNGQSDFRSNSFGEHVVGLRILKGAVVDGTIGDQERHGNTWPTTANPHLLYKGYCQGVALLSEFIIENQFPQGSAFFPTNIFPNVTWFKNEGSASDWCLPTPPEFSPENPVVRLSDYDNAIAEGSGGFDTLSLIMQWEAKRQLLDKLLRYPALQAESATANSFFNSNMNSSAGKFAQVDYQLRQAYQIASGLQTAIDATQDQRAQLLTTLDTIETNINVPSTVQAAMAANPISPAATKSAIMAQLWQLHLDAANQKAQVRQDLESKLQAVLTATNQLPTSTAFEANRKLFYGLAIQLTLTGTLNETDEGLLSTLTAESQAEGGMAVSDAKILLPLCQGAPASPRSGIHAIQKSASSIQIPGTMTIAPNPSDGNFVVSSPELEQGNITLYDLSGKLWQTQHVPKGVNFVTIQTEGLPSGVYFVRFQGESGKALNSKLILQR